MEKKSNLEKPKVNLSRFYQKAQTFLDKKDYVGYLVSLGTQLVKDLEAVRPHLHASKMRQFQNEWELLEPLITFNPK